MEKGERFIFDRNEKPSTRNGEEANNPVLHNSDLFDQDEDVRGEKIDLATGEPIDNSTYTGLEDLTVIDNLRSISDKKDAAALWLEENDPDLR